MQVPVLPIVTAEELNVLHGMLKFALHGTQRMVSDCRLYGIESETLNKYARKEAVAAALLQRVEQLRLAIPSVVIDAPPAVVRETQEPQEPNEQAK